MVGGAGRVPGIAVMSGEGADGGPANWHQGGMLNSAVLSIGSKPADETVPAARLSFLTLSACGDTLV